MPFEETPVWTDRSLNWNSPESVYFGSVNTSRVCLVVFHWEQHERRVRYSFQMNQLNNKWGKIRLSYYYMHTPLPRCTWSITVHRSPAPSFKWVDNRIIGTWLVRETPCTNTKYMAVHRVFIIWRHCYIWNLKNRVRGYLINRW